MKSLVLLINFLHFYKCEIDILFDSQQSPELLSIDGNWEFQSNTSLFAILNGNSTDVIKTRNKIEYADRNFNIVFVNVSYYPYPIVGNLILALNAFDKNNNVFNSEYIISRQTKQNDLNGIRKIVAYNATAGIELTLKCKGFFGVIARIVVFTYYCGATIIGRAYYPRVEIDPFESIYVQSTKCTNGSEIQHPKHTPYASCLPDGTYLPIGGNNPNFNIDFDTVNSCDCSKGMGYINGTCYECASNQYKDSVSNTPCFSCGNNSYSNNNKNRTTCECISGYYRAYDEKTNNQATCYPKSPCPANITIGGVTTILPYQPKTNDTVTIQCKHSGSTNGECIMGKDGISLWVFSTISCNFQGIWVPQQSCSDNITVEDDTKGNYFVNTSGSEFMVNQTIALQCKHGGGNVTFKCTIDSNGYAKWVHDLSSCKSSDSVNNHKLIIPKLCSMNATFGHEESKGKYFIKGFQHVAFVNKFVQFPCKYGGGNVTVKCMLNVNGTLEWKPDLSRCNIKSKNSSIEVDFLKTCSSDITFGKDEDKGQYFINASQYNLVTNDVTQFPCKYGGGNVTSKCIVDINGTALWEYDLSSCKEKIRDNVTQLENLAKKPVTIENLGNVSSRLTKILKETDKITGKDIEDTVEIIENVLSTDNTNIKVNYNILQVADILGSEKESSLEQSGSQSKILSALDTIAMGNLENKNYTAYSGNAIALKGSTIATTGGDLHVTVVRKKRGNIAISASQGNTRASIDIPAKIKIPRETLIEKGLLGKKFFSYVYKDDRFFMSSNYSNSTKKQKLDSYILSLKFINESLNDLQHPIQLEFKLLNFLENDDSKCSFWKKGIYRAYWSREGCQQTNLVTRNDQKFATCSCNHLTNFAMIFIPEEDVEEAALNMSLEVVSFIGCTVSIVALAITLLTHVLFKKLRQKTPQKILINFCFSLLCLLVIFSAGVKQVQYELPCKVTASMIQFFLLTTFAWMGIEGVGLYKKIVRATQNRGDDKKFYRISFALGWGIPVVIILCTGIASKDQHHTAVCMIPWDIFFYTTLIPICCILLMNFILFVPIIKEIQQHISTRSEVFKKNTSYVHKATITISCTLLLGLTWIFGVFLVIKELQEVFQWLFCIFNSLQGFFIFFFNVIRNDEVVKEWSKLLGRNIRNDTSNSGTNQNKLSSRFKVFKEDIIIENNARSYDVSTNSGSL